ncbi:MAG TPA: PBP1A family penicillin-binding protein [Acetobacteraceae bacterium]|nr:PBP1A family penicillin-binding protein [Acetobacteraceae bacterium]
MPNAKHPARVSRQRPAKAPPSARAKAEAPKRARAGRFFRALRLAVILSVWGALALAAVVLWFARDLPHPQDALLAVRRPSLVLEDHAGRIFATYGDVVGQPLTLGEMPAYLPEAVVAIEDRRFWSEPGFDPLGMMRAGLADLLAGRVVEGGSTITQQVAKNLFLSDARTLKRKVQEALLTLWLTHAFTRREILEIWLNRVYFGAGAWGVDAAARIYFGVSARNVSLWQAAVLAGLPQAPSVLNPLADPQAAAARGRQVLAAMAASGAITPAEAASAAAQIHFPPPVTVGGGWFADWVSEQARPDLPPGQDVVLATTLDGTLQATVESRLDSLLAGPGAAAGVHQGAVVVLDAATGAVLAMAGGRDYRANPFNRAVLALRQPGSAFKPFVWLAALEKGYRPSSPVLDAPIDIDGYHPHDFDPTYLGRVTLTDALAFSLNTASVRLLLAAGGPEAVIRVARRLGITSKLPDNASLALGTGGVSLLELAGAYCSFFNGGLLVTPHGLASISTGGGSIPLGTPQPLPAIDPSLAAMMAKMMTAVVSRGTGRNAAIAGRTIAGKTGTTSDFRDAWFVGWTDGDIIGVWLGNDNASPTKNVDGGSLPATLFREIALTIHD